jgi:hypothetical protein
VLSAQARRDAVRAAGRDASAPPALRLPSRLLAVIGIATASLLN